MKEINGFMCLDDSLQIILIILISLLAFHKWISGLIIYFGETVIYYYLYNMYLKHFCELKVDGYSQNLCVFIARIQESE
jgi:hypothetical protein